MSSPRFLMVAGEASGDMYGAEVARVLFRRFPDCSIYGLGGAVLFGASTPLSRLLYARRWSTDARRAAVPWRGVASQRFSSDVSGWWTAVAGGQDPGFRRADARRSGWFRRCSRARIDAFRSRTDFCIDRVALLNLEGVFTILLAVIVFHEHLSRSLAAASCLVVLGRCY